MSTAIPAVINTAKNLPLNPAVAGKAASFLGSTQEILPRAGTGLNLASDEFNRISPIAMA